MYTDALAYALATIEADADLLQEMDRQLSLFPEEVNQVNWMSAERIFTLDYNRSGGYAVANRFDLDEILDEVTSFSEGVGYLGACILPVWDELYYIKNMMELEPVYAQPYAQINWPEIDRRYRETPKSYLLSAESLHYRRILGSLTAAKTRILLSKVAVELYRMHLETGTFPDDLSGITKEHPTDPFVGAPLKYEKTVDGFRLYSVGPNQLDDGGVKDRKSDKDDLLWSHPYEQP